MMIILTIVILKLLIMLDLWLSIIDLNNPKHVKKKKKIDGIQQDGEIGGFQKTKKRS